jgi:hypothetical protein
VFFQEAGAPCANRPTRLADGLELESAPIRNADPRPVKSARLRWFPRVRALGPDFGYTSIHHTIDAGRGQRNIARRPLSLLGYSAEDRTKQTWRRYEDGMTKECLRNNFPSFRSSAFVGDAASVVSLPAKTTLAASPTKHANREVISPPFLKRRKKATTK